MENLERELEFAKAENVLLRLFRAFEKAVSANNENMADELANGLLNRIPEHKANLFKRVDYLRNDVLAAQSKEERVKLLETIKSIEPELELWSKKLKKVEKYLDRSAYFSSPKDESEAPSKIEKPIGFKLVKKNPVATATEIQLLVKIADSLDSKGFFNEATIIDDIMKKAIGPSQRVQQWQQAYNKRYNLKPGAVGYLKENGVWGPETQTAFKKDKEMKMTNQIFNDPRKQPFDVNQIPSRGSLISNRLIVAADKSSLIRALKEDNAKAAKQALTGMSGNDLGLTHQEFQELADLINSAATNTGFKREPDAIADMDDARKMLGIGKNIKVDTTMTHNPVTGLPYSAPMPKGHCPECGKKLVMRYPGGDPENGPAGERCPQGHQGAEPCELCPHFFHTDKCKEAGCDCYSSWGTEEQQKEEEEMMKKMYGDDWDKDPRIDPDYGGP